MRDNPENFYILQRTDHNGQTFCYLTKNKGLKHRNYWGITVSDRMEIFLEKKLKSDPQKVHHRPKCIH